MHNTLVLVMSALFVVVALIFPAALLIKRIMRHHPNETGEEQQWKPSLWSLIRTAFIRWKSNRFAKRWYEKYGR